MKVLGSATHKPGALGQRCNLSKTRETTKAHEKATDAGQLLLRPSSHRVHCSTLQAGTILLPSLWCHLTIFCGLNTQLASMSHFPVLEAWLSHANTASSQLLHRLHPGVWPMPLLPGPASLSISYSPLDSLPTDPSSHHSVAPWTSHGKPVLTSPLSLTRFAISYC